MGCACTSCSLSAEKPCETTMPGSGVFAPSGSSSQPLKVTPSASNETSWRMKRPFAQHSTIRFRRNGCTLYILDLACLIVESNIGSGFGFTE
jgi:hypothetical protein